MEKTLLENKIKQIVFNIVTNYENSNYVIQNNNGLSFTFVPRVEADKTFLPCRNYFTISICKTDAYDEISPVNIENKISIIKDPNWIYSYAVGELTFRNNNNSEIVIKLDLYNYTYYFKPTLTELATIVSGLQNIATEYEDGSINSILAIMGQVEDMKSIDDINV